MSISEKDDESQHPWESTDPAHVRGSELLTKLGRINVHNEDALNEIVASLPIRDAEAYVRYVEYLDEADRARMVRAPGDKRKGPILDDHFDAALDRCCAMATTLSGTVDKLRSQCQVFFKIVRELERCDHLSQLAVRHFQHYCDMLRKLPLKVLPSDTRTISELSKLKPGTVISNRTVFAHAQAVNHFLKWCSEQHYDIDSSYTGIFKPLLKKPRRTKKLRDAFTPQQLQTIFGSVYYKMGSFKRASDYWLPLIALHSGARQAEICQLQTTDVIKKDGVWLFDINDHHAKRVKTIDSTRQVPIHPQLLSLGFLEFVQGRISEKQSRLFPTEERNKRGEFSGYSKRFNRWREQNLGIASTPQSKLDFHSFRHVFESLLRNQQIPDYIIDKLTGHSLAKHSEGVKSYTEISLATFNKVVADATFEIDYNAIRPNGFTEKQRLTTFGDRSV